VKNVDNLERAVVGALQSAILDHGPITPEHVGSTARRIVGDLVNGRPGRGTYAVRRWMGPSREMPMPAPSRRCNVPDCGDRPLKDRPTCWAHAGLAERRVARVARAPRVTFD
jgi:hypothetical protein